MLDCIYRSKGLNASCWNDCLTCCQHSSLFTTEIYAVIWFFLPGRRHKFLGGCVRKGRASHVKICQIKHEGLPAGTTTCELGSSRKQLNLNLSFLFIPCLLFFLLQLSLTLLVFMCTRNCLWLTVVKKKNTQWEKKPTANCRKMLPPTPLTHSKDLIWQHNNFQNK